MQYYSKATIFLVVTAQNCIHAIDLYLNSDLLFMSVPTYCDLAGALRKVVSVTRFGSRKGQSSGWM